MTVTSTKPKKKKEPIFYTKQKQDNIYLCVVLLVLAVGLVMMFSASYITAYFESEDGDSFTYIRKQLIFAVIGVAVMLFISCVNYKKLLNFKTITVFYIICVVLLIAVLVMGASEGEAKRWLVVGSISFQPSEFAKLAVIMALAYYYSKFHREMNKPLFCILLPCAIIALVVILVFMERHLSGTILILAVGAVMMLLNIRGKGNWAIVAVLAIICVAVLIYASMKIDYMRERIEIFKDPWAVEMDGGYQTVHSLMAIGSGGLTGLGLGNSRQKFLYLPKPQNDYVFAVVAEELGFIGCVVILALFAFIIYKGFVIAINCPDRMGSLIAFGISFRLALQVILNVAVVTNAIPCTGISLPFFSSGGTALLVQLAEIGIMLSISRQTNIAKA